MYDVIIVGGGPAGLSAAIYARRSALETLVLEGGNWGGAIIDARRVDNYPGAFGVSGYELAESFREQAGKLGAELQQKTVVELCEKGGYRELTLKDGSAIEGKTVIIATGTRRTPLEVNGSELPGVSYCASCDGAFFRDKAVCVIGGGDSAVDSALLLAGMCSKVSLIHRRKTFRAAQRNLKRFEALPNTEIITDAVVREVRGEGKVSGVVIEDTLSGWKRELPVSGVFVAIGSKPNTHWLPAGIKRDKGGYIEVTDGSLTTLPGIFAAGDVRANTFRQVVTAAADGASCAHAAETFLKMPARKVLN